MDWNTLGLPEKNLETWFTDKLYQVKIPPPPVTHKEFVLYCFNIIKSSKCWSRLILKISQTTK